MKKNEKKNKRDVTPSNHKDDLNNKKPLFKLFMDQNKNNKKKLHLIKSTVNESKDFQYQWKNCEGDKYFQSNNLNLQLFSYKVLEAKHNSTPELYLKKTLNILIKKRKCHLLAYFNEISICTTTLRDFLKRFYTYKESKERIPKYVSYYKNYLIFFCRPYFTNYFINKKMVKHMEKVAQIFYNENYADEEDKEEEEKKKKDKKITQNIQIFSKKISEEIENCDVFTVVTSEAAMKQIQLINKKIIKNNEFKKIENNINNLNNNINNDKNNQYFINDLKPIEIEQSTILENSYKITPINNIDDQKINFNKKINYNMNMKKSNDINKPQPTNSISLIIEELEHNNNINKNNNDNNIFNNKIIGEGNNIFKNINNNCIVIQGGKTTNNINININHLTIGQKIIPQNENYNIINGLSDLNNNYHNNNFNNTSKKIIKKLKNKENNNNSLMNLKDKNANKKINNYIASAPQKINIKDKNKNSSLTLPPPSQNVMSTLSKKFTKICPNTINNYNQINNLRNKPLKETRNKSVFRGGYNSGSMTNLHKYKNNISNNFSKSQQKFGKIKIYTNNTNYLKNVINNINYGTTKMKKNNNIIYSKNNGIFSGERGRSSSNMQKRPKKVFSSILQFNGGNIQLLSFKNLDNNKHTDNINIVTPISKGKINEIIPLIQNKENIYYKDNNRGFKIKDYKLKGRQLNLHKILNMAHSNKRTRSTDK